MIRRPPSSPLFPYTTLSRSQTPRRPPGRPPPAEEVVRGPAALHPETLHRRVPEAEPHLVAGAFLHLDQRAHRGVMRHRSLRRESTSTTLTELNTPIPYRSRWV